MVRNLDENVLDLTQVPIISKFLNVFPKELPRLPLDREVEFCIDMISRTQPILLPTYRMALAKIKELKSQ